MGAPASWRADTSGALVMGSQLGWPHGQWDPVLPGLLIFLEKLRDLDFYVKTADSYNLAANVQFLCTT